MSVLVLGDVHGQYEQLKSFYNYKNKDYSAVIVCGDYGIWNDVFFKEGELVLPDRYKIELGCPIYFCDGNHENHNTLDRFERGKIHKLCDNVNFCAYGSHLSLEGKEYLFLGGASSIDKLNRVEGESWWRTEVITEEDNTFIDYTIKYDYVISHTAPTSVCREMSGTFSTHQGKFIDPSTYYLEEVLSKIKHPELNWIYGHWHVHKKYKIADVQFNGLNMLPISRNTFTENYWNQFEEFTALHCHSNIFYCEV